MEYHYILEWDLVTPYGVNMIREEYFGDKVISSSYTLTSEGITEVNYSDRAAYFIDDGGVRKEELKDNNVEPAHSEPIDEKLKELMSILDNS